MTPRCRFHTQRAYASLRRDALLVDADGVTINLNGQVVAGDPGGRAIAVAGDRTHADITVVEATQFVGVTIRVFAGRGVYGFLIEALPPGSIRDGGGNVSYGDRRGCAGVVCAYR